MIACLRKKAPSVVRMFFNLLVVVVLLPALSCKKVPEEKLSGTPPRGRLTVKSVEDRVATPEPRIIEIEPEADTTGEVRIKQSTSASVAEEKSPEKRGKYVSKRCNLFGIVEGRMKKRSVLDPGLKVEVLAKVAIVNKRNKESPAYRVRLDDGREGYIYARNLCDRKICVEVLRKGVVEMYDPEKTRDKRLPQIKFKIRNANVDPVEELHVVADFYYKGEHIGTDDAFPVSGTHGMLPLKPGGHAEIFLRPMYELEDGEVLSEENPVRVDIKCSMEYGEYQECGEFYIDEMAY